MATPAIPQALTAAQSNQLQGALGLLKAGNATAALAIARRLAAEAAHAPDAQQFLAMCLADAGAADAADAAFQQALALAPNHPLILGNYAGFLSRLGLAALAAGSVGHALAVLKRAVSVHPGSALAWHALGNARRADGDLEGSAAAFRQALDLAPNYGSAWVNLGAVQRLLGHADDTIASFEQAGKAGQAGPELADALAGALLDVGKFQQSLELSRQVTREFPEFVEGHVTLANLLWEYGADSASGDPIQDFRAALQRQPRNDALRLAFARFLLSARQADEALEHVRRLRSHSAEPMLAVLEADALAMRGEHQRAGELYASVHPGPVGGDPAFLNTYTRHRLRVGDCAGAAALATAALAIDQDNQEALAYLGTAWRLLDDPREFWLFDYENLIGMVDVEPPAGISGTEEFLAALATTLESMHQAKREPVQQSLRGGSQTPGRLFGRRDPMIEATRLALLQSVERWIAGLPSDPRHPFLRRKLPSVRFSGSWSVKLWSSGSHVNHIHQQGWMSSAFYVSLPPSVQLQSSDGRAGWIQFGQPPLDLGLDLAPRRQLRPEPGKLALFPSYQWHGTVPFQDPVPRLTIAFDMIPSRDLP